LATAVVVAVPVTPGVVSPFVVCPVPPPVTLAITSPSSSVIPTVAVGTAVPRSHLVGLLAFLGGKNDSHLPPIDHLLVHLMLRIRSSLSFNKLNEREASWLLRMVVTRNVNIPNISVAKES
jgi:hypothetical protein